MSAREEVMADAISCLFSMFEHPRASTQRIVEQLAFLPGGGQRWSRSLQIQIPGTAKPEQVASRIVSVGMFRRRRYPDIEITDGTGATVSMLTRDEHGTALMNVVLGKHFLDFTGQLEKLVNDEDRADQRALYRRLQDGIYDELTSVGDPSTDGPSAKALGRTFWELLASFSLQAHEIYPRVEAFRASVNDILEATHYLCWVRAEAGEIVNLEVMHTAADRRQRANWDRAKAGEARERRRARRLRHYSEFGLAPLKTECRIPSNGLTGSYYFTIEPPPKSEILYLDWEAGNSLQDTKAELDSAHDSLHLHYEQDSQPEGSERARAVRAYFRCATHGHKQIAAGAVLNFVFVLLLARGGFSDVVGNSAQTWLLATPTLLTAYIAEQQRHYYAYATRRQRAMLWLYLALSVTFLVAISFRLASGNADSAHWSTFLLATAYALLVASTAVALWYALIGYSFRWITERWARRRFASAQQLAATTRTLLSRYDPPEHVHERVLAMVPSGVEIYERVVTRYCRLIARTVAGAVALTVIALVLWWHPTVKLRTSHASAPAPACTMACGRR